MTKVWRFSLPLPLLLLAFASMSVVSAQTSDFGDAPTAYGSASHVVGAGLPTLGTIAPDTEAGDGRNGVVIDPAASEDDTNDGAVAAGGVSDDEDAFSSLPPVATSDSSYTVTVPLRTAAGAGATLAAWIDFNRDNTFAANEGIVTTVAAGATSATLTFNATNTPGFASKSAGRTYARFRIATTAGSTLTTSTPTGSQPSGEIEDHPILILDAPTVCEGSPVSTLDFSSPVLISGTALSVGAEYRFPNVAAGLDAIVRIDAFGGTGTVTDIDDSAAGDSRGFQPTLGSTDLGNVDFTITFVVGGSRTPYALTKTFAHALDIDGDNATKREYVDLSGYTSYTLDSPTGITYTANPTAGFSGRFESTTAAVQPGISLTATESIARAVYDNVSTFKYRIGSLGTGTSARQNSLYFQCISFGQRRDVSIDKKQRVGTTGTFVDTNIALATGNTVQYQLIIANPGVAAAGGTTFTDTLPASLGTPSIVGTPVVAGGAAGCTASFSGNTVSGTVGTLPTGGTCTVTVQATVLTATSPIANTATVSPPSGTSDTVTTNNTDTVTTAGPDLTVTKAQSAATLAIGATNTYTLTVRNPGTTATTGTITVTDTLPVGVTVNGGAVGAITEGGTNSAAWTCTSNAASPQVVTCTSATAIAAGGNSVFSFVATVGAGTAVGTNSITNTATISGGGEGNTSNNSATVSTTVQSPNLTISKSHTPATFTRGSTGAYTIRVDNTGTATTSGTITVTDTLPTGLSVAAGAVTLSGTNAAAWSCSASGQTITCTSTTAIAISGTSVFTFNVNVAATAAASVTNSVSIAGGNEATINTGNNTATDPTQTAGADLTIAKSHTGNFTVGSAGNYSFTVTNGGIAATNGTITVTDILPTGLTFNGGAAGAVTTTGTNAASWTCSANASSPQTVTCTSTTAIAAAGTSTFGFSPTVGVDAAVGTNSITNTASVVGGGDITAADSNNDQATVLSPNLTIAKSHTPTTFVRGSTGTYTLTVGNTGTVATSGTITVTDTLPTGLSVPAGTVTLSGTNAAAWSCSASGQTITCTSSAALAISGSSIFSFNVSVDTGAASSVTNTVSVAGGNEATANAGNNTASDPTTTVAPTDLTLAKSHTGSFTVGQTGTYNFTVNNTGGVASSGTITVTDTLPAGLTFVAGSTSGAGWSCSASGQTVTCTSTTAIAAAGNSTFAFNVNVGVGTAPGTNSITNTASVSGGGDANAGNNSASDPTTVLSPNVTITKTHSGNFTRGTTGTYSITVGNTGTAPTSGTITVTDTLPTGLTYVAGSVGGTNGGNWSCSAAGQTLTCTSTTAIATGGSSVFTFNVDVAATTASSVTNTATASGGNEATANTANNTANDPTTTVGTPDLTIDKSHTDTFIRGSSGTYTFVVGNSGSVATSGTLTLTDTLPANFTVNGGAAGSVTAGGTNGVNWTCSSNAASPQVITCTSTTAVAAGGSSTLSLNVSVGAAAAASVNNTVSVAGGGELAANTANNSDVDPTTTVSAADLTLAKTHTGSFTVGSTGTYSFTVANGGETSSTGTITVTDTLPAGLTYAGSVGGTNGANWACSASGQTVTCTSSAVITAASSSTFTFDVTVGTGTAPGTNSVTNTATVSGGGDSNTANNAASDPTTILSSNLTISKTHTPTSFIRGSTGTYTLTVGNAGTAATSGTITVTDTLPAGLSIPSGTVTLSGTNAVAWSCSASGQTITCTSTAAIPVSGSSTFSFSVNVDAGAGSSVTNTVSVAGGNEAAANTGNNTASDPTATTTPADLTLAKTHTGNFTVGQTGTYSLTVTNGGGSATSGTITVTDTLPTGLTYVAGSVGGTNGGNWSCSAAGQTLTCTSTTAIPITTGSNTSTFTFGVSVGTGTAVPSVTNTASVVGGGDTTSANSNGDLTTILSPNLTLAKTHTPATFVRGSTGTYTLSVSNSGTAPTSGTLTVTDTLPSGLSLPAGAVTISGADAAAWSCTASGQTVTCISTAAVPVGGTSVFSFNVDVAANAAATVTNTASVAGGNEATANAGNNTASDDTPTAAPVDLTLVKTAAGPFVQGSTGSYTLTVSNSGGTPTSGTLTVTDTLPTGLSYSAASGSGWSCSASGQTVTCTTSTVVTAGGSAPPITLTVNVLTGAPATVTNTATVSGGGDTTPANNSGSASTSVTAVDLTLSKSHVGDFTVGSTGTYALSVTNGGTAPSSGTITVTDTLPAGLTVNGGAAGSVTPAGTNAANWTCSSNAASPQVVTCTSSTAVSAGGSSLFGFSVSVGTGTAPGTNSITNTASVSGGGDANTANNGASDPTTVLSPNLTISKTHTGNFVRGTTGTYTITVGNTGTAPTSGTLTFTDTLPVGLSVNGGAAGPVTAGGVQGGFLSCASNATSPQLITCTATVSIGVSQSGSFTLSVAVAPNAPTSVTNSVAVSGGNEATANAGNNTASDPTTTVGSADLTLSKTASSTFVRGSTGTYTLTVTNGGDAPSSGTITVTDVLPTGLSYSGFSGAGWSCSASGQTVTCTTSSVLAVGGTSSVALTVAVAANAPASIDNTATVSGGGELNTGNNSSTATTPTVNAGSLVLTKTVRNVTQSGTSGTTNQGKPGDVLEYCISYSNPGQSQVTGAVMNDTIPLSTTAETTVADYGGAAIRWQVTVPTSSSQNLSAGVDSDAGELAAALTVRLGTVAAGGAGNVCFRVSIVEEQ